jgi:hypothetical protein
LSQLKKSQINPPLKKQLKVLLLLICSTESALIDFPQEFENPFQIKFIKFEKGIVAREKEKRKGGR